MEIETKWRMFDMEYYKLISCGPWWQSEFGLDLLKSVNKLVVSNKCRTAGSGRFK